jgi:hypothetical protein
VALGVALCGLYSLELALGSAAAVLVSSSQFCDSSETAWKMSFISDLELLDWLFFSTLWLRKQRRRP